jgi:Zn-dependent protease with chaperone function
VARATSCRWIDRCLRLREVSRRNPRSPGAIGWIDLYGLCLLGGIVAHVTVAVAAFYELLFLAIDLAMFDWDLGVVGITRGVGLIVVGVFLIRTGRYLWDVTRGLVTPRHEPDSAFLRGIGLDRFVHRELHEAVAEASCRVGAPKPDEIRINHRPACCAAEFREFGVRTQRRLVVVLGLPILTVFNVGELKVILGHELAHIGRGDTRLEVFMVRVLEMLRRQAPEARQRWWRWLDPLAWYAWGSAAVLAFLLGPMWRHQELRADSLSAAAYGGELAARTLLKDWLAVHEFAQAVLSFDGDGRPDAGSSPQSVFHRFAERWQEFSRVGQEYLERRLREEERPSFWDSHPTVHARTAAMRRFPPRTEEDQRPARELLPDFDDLAAKLHEAALGDDLGAEDADCP